MVMPQSPIQRPTIYDVARRAGVSKSLVSLVLQGSGRVSAGRRAAVLTAIDDLGYRPSRAATLLASHRTKSVEVVIDDYRNLSFVDLVTGIQSALSADGYHLTVTDRRLNAHLAEQGAGSLLSTNLDGLIIAGEPDDELLRGWEGPTVVAGWRTALPTEPIWSPTTTSWADGWPPTTCWGSVTAPSVTSPAPAGPRPTDGRVSPPASRRWA